jgi:hypothetical protein
MEQDHFQMEIPISQKEKGLLQVDCLLFGLDNAKFPPAPNRAFRRLTRFDEEKKVS